MQTLTFFFDPLCPWAWRTSLWVREVQRLNGLPVNWKVFSLMAIHQEEDHLATGPAPLDSVLRAVIQVRRQAGNEAVERFYLALGRARFDRHEDIKTSDVVEAALEAAGLDRTLLSRAIADPTTDADAKAEHREAVERYGSFGVPWLVLGAQEFGFFGPIILEVPEGQAALDLWEHASWMLVQPHVYELKRTRP